MPVTLPAVVTIQDLPAGTTPTGAELIEAVQFTGFTTVSVKLSLSQIATALPTALATIGGLSVLGVGGTSSAAPGAIAGTAGEYLQVNASGTGLAFAPLGAANLATVAGLSVLGVGGSASAVPLPIAGSAGQVLVVNDAGTALAFGAIDLANGTAVTGVLSTTNMTAINLALSGGGGVTGTLPAANMTSVNLGSTGAGGVRGFLPGTSIATASLTGAQIATATIGTTQLFTAAGLSVLAVNTSGTAAFSVVTGTAGQVLQVTAGGAGVAFETISGAIALSGLGTATFQNIAQTIVTATVHTTVTTEREVFVNTAAAVTVHVIAATTWYAADTNGLPLVIADVSGSASANNITVSFLSDTCAGTSTLTIADDFGFFRIRPISSGNWIIL
jgi:hypothetical protein